MNAIARVWTGRTAAGLADQFLDYMKRTGVRDLSLVPGNLGVLVLRRADGDAVEFTLISFWESEEAIARFAGEDIRKAVYYSEDSRFLERLEPEVVHWQVSVSEKLPLGRE